MMFLAWLLAAFGVVDWTRIAYDPKGGGEDKPAPHTLSYFTQYPSLHDTYEYCSGCTAEQTQAAARKDRVRSDVRLLGRWNGRSVYDILYYFDDENEPRWKSLIVQKSSGLYGEILQVHMVNPPDPIRHSYVVRKGLVCARDNCDRTGCIAPCFRIDAEGPVYVGYAGPQ
jgi:hypothetical protein